MRECCREVIPTVLCQTKVYSLNKDWLTEYAEASLPPPQRQRQHRWRRRNVNFKINGGVSVLPAILRRVENKLLKMHEFLFGRNETYLQVLYF